MMDKKSANGFQTKASEGGVQRKQLPYSVETPYGFHLDLDFLKYVDDIEKGNTIKRVHIQRRVKGPPKFSTLPRNFSLPGHGVRPVPKEKDTTWSGTSTLGPKPKSRVTEVQQIFDFRASEGGTSSQRLGYVSAKRDDTGPGARDVEDKIVGIQSRPNLLRASSMPVTIQQRKGSDSSSPDRFLGTPDSGSTENIFRPSPDITERRSGPPERTGLHQQITVALKRVRELEEQVKTIPELKAQICSLRQEREKLLLQLQAQVQAQVSASSSSTAQSSDSGTYVQAQGRGLNLALKTQPSGGSEASQGVQAKPVTGRETQDAMEKSRVLQKETVTNQEAVQSSSSEICAPAEQKSERAQLPEKSDKQKETFESPVESAVRKLSQDLGGPELTSLRVAIKEADTSGVQAGNAAIAGQLGNSEETQKLQEKLMTLEAKLSQASQELEKTNALFQEQLEENKVKEERILQLSEEARAEVCMAEAQSRPRRESIDTGTETERVDFANQETETEPPGLVNQGTDTERISIEVCLPSPERVDQGTEAMRVEQETEREAELAAANPPRPRTNSMERGTVTERIATQDQMTETPVAERVNQVTETEGEAATDHPQQRPRASSVDRATLTERVGTVDRVTETEAASRSDQQTETGTSSRGHNNPARGVQAESQVEQSVGTEEVEEGVREEEVGSVVSERVEDQVTSEGIQRNSGEGESVAVEVTESSSSVVESGVDQIVVSDIVSQDEGPASPLVAMGEDTESKIEKVPAQNDSEKKEEETVLPKTEVTDVVETQQIVPEVVEKREAAVGEIVRATVKETVVTDTVVVVVAPAENEAVKTAAPPVRPQRGRRTSAEQVQPPQLQAPPVRPRRGSSETQAQPPQPQPRTQFDSQLQSKSDTQPHPQSDTQPQPKSDTQPQVQPQSDTQPQSDSQPQSQTQTEALPQAEVQGTPEPEPQTTSQLPEPQVKPPAPSPPPGDDQILAEKPAAESGEKQSKSPQAETKGPSPSSSEVKIRPKSIQAQSKSQTTATRRDSKELKATQKGSGATQPQRRGSGEAKTRPTRQGSSDTQPQSQGSRRSSGETQPPHKDSLRRGSSETVQRRGSSESQASRRGSSGEGQTSRRDSTESPTSPAALGQVVTRLTGLLGEQWAQLGSGSGAQQTVAQQDTPSAQKQPAGKRAEAGKGASAKPAGKATPAAAAATAATTGKAAGKPGPSKMSSIQSQLVSSLSVLSAFYSPAQKAAAAKKQQEQGLKSIMKKNGVADKQGNKGAKKNLKFVGVNGGYETTSSEESSGDEKSKVELEPEEEDSSEPEVDKEKEKETDPEPEPAEKPQEEPEADTQQKDAEAPAEGAEGGAAAGGHTAEVGLLDLESSHDLLEELAGREKVDQNFIDACLYVKDRMEEVTSPDKEMRQVLVVLYQEWFKVSSQKASEADTVRLYLRQVGLTTPTLLPYVVNLTDGNGNMALHYSVSHSNFPVVKLLLDTGLCETDNVNKAGYTPVMLAALTAADSPDDLEVAQQLLKLGDVNACSRQAGQTALMLAVSHGRVPLVRLLLGCGADVNAQDRESSTALMCASEHGHTHIVRLLLDTGRCDVSLTDKNGQTALSVAEAASHQDIVDLLKEYVQTQTSEPSSSSSTSLL